MDRKEQAFLCLLSNTSVVRCWPVHPGCDSVFHEGLESCPVYHGSTYCICGCLYLVCVLYMLCFCLLHLFHFMSRPMPSFNSHFLILNIDRLIPESARWLLDRGKTERAKQLVLKAAAINKRTVPDRLLEKVFF